jgi:hypothetical protein
LKFANRTGFCGLSLLRDLGSFLGSKKGKKWAKIAKRFFFQFARAKLKTEN